MLKVNDEVVIIKSAFVGFEGTVVELSNVDKRVRVKLKNDDNNETTRWFNEDSVMLIAEKTRKLYKIIDLENDIFYFNLTEEQANFLDSLYRKSIINDYEEISRLDIIEP